MIAGWKRYETGWIPPNLPPQLIQRHLPDPTYRVFLFGSRATGSAGERPDIDIGIEGPGPVWIAALAAIHDELEDSPTLYTRARLII